MHKKLIPWLQWLDQQLDEGVPDIEELEAAGELGHDDDAEDYGNGALACHEATVECSLQLIAHDVVAGPEDSCSRDEWEDAADDEDDDGAMEGRCALIRREHDDHGGEEHSLNAAGAEKSGEDQIDNPAKGAADASSVIEAARNAEEDGKADCAKVGYFNLNEPVGRERVGEHAVKLDHASKDVAVDDEDGADSYRHAEEDHEGIGKAGHAGKIVFGGKVADAVGE